MNKVILVLILSSALFACNKKNAVVKETTPSENRVSDPVPFSVKGVDFVVRQGEGFDSQVGRIITPSNKFSYDFGWYSDEGPSSLLDNFTKTFKAYHHQAFLTAVGMDPKTFPIFKEEANIIQIILKERADFELMFECDNCNVVAEIEFKDKLWYFPYQEGKELVDIAENYEFTYFEDQNWKYKIYRSLSKVDDCGLYAYPKDKENLSRMSVVCQEVQDQGEAERFLLMFRMETE